MPTLQPDDAPQFHLITLGRAALVPASEPQAAPLLGPGKSLALVTYLAFAAQRSCRRADLVDLLWGDRDPERGRNSLRQLLWQLRQRIDESFLDGDEDTIQLTGRLTTDRDLFLTAMQARRYQQAAMIYGGPFLPDFALPGGLAFEHWAERERAGLRAMFHQAGEAAARAHLGRGESREATVLARRVRDAEPDRESGWRFLLESCATAGDWLSLMREAEALVTWLNTENRTAEPATRSLLNRLRPDALAPAAEEPLGAIADLVGREAQFAALLQAWEGVRRGRAAQVHLVASAGLGKSRLAGEFGARLQGIGATVVNCRARPGERMISWTLLGDLIELLGKLPGTIGVAPESGRMLVRLAPALSSLFGQGTGESVPPQDRRAAGLALLDLIAAVTQDRPLTVVIDDLHWIDDASRDALMLALPRLENLPILLLTLSRPEDRPEPESTFGRRIELPRLTLEETGQLLASMATLPPDPWATELPRLLHDAAEGIPLHIMESLALVIDRGQLSHAGGAWSCNDSAALRASLSAGSALRTRLQGLSTVAHRVLLTSAVAGRPLTTALLGAAADLETEPIELQLHQLERDGFVVRGTGGWEVGHDRIREVLLESVEPTTRCEVHAALGRAMMEEGETARSRVPVIAQHLLTGDDRVTLAQLMERQVEVARRREDRRSASAIIGDLLGSLGGEELVEQLTGELPWRLRSRWLSRPVLAAIVLAACIATVGLLILKQPRLVVVSQPIAISPLTPAPAVEIQDGFGRRLVDFQDSVTVEVAAGPGPLVGNSTVVAREGRAVYGELDVPVLGRYVLRFTSAGARSTESDTIAAEISDATIPRLSVTGGELNGVNLRVAHPEVRVGPGARLRGNVEMVYRSTWSTAAVFLCGTTSWRDARTAGWTVAAVATPTLSTQRVAAVDLVAPEVSGRYRIIFALYADRTCDHVLSATNWTVNRPVWGDGNDIADMDSTTVREAVARGTITAQQLRRDAEQSVPGLKPTSIGVAVIDVVVE